MNADLMRAPSFRNRANQSKLVSCRRRSCKPPLNAKFSDGCRASWMNHLFEPNRRRLMFSLSIKRRIDRFRFPVRPAPNNREIFFVQMSILHEQTKPAGSRGSFGNKDNSARFAIESIHDRNLSSIGDFEREQLPQLFPKCWALIGFRRMG